MTVPDDVRRFLLAELEYLGDEEELTTDYPLLEAGVLDSLGIMALVEYLEAEFDIVIDEDDVVAEHFLTIAAVAALVSTKRAA